MIKNYTMNEIISGYFDKQFVTTNEVPQPKFSFHHRRVMKRIFKLFAHNKRKMFDDSATEDYKNLLRHKRLSFRKRLIIVSLIIVCLAMMTGFVIMFISQSFNGTVYQDNTHLFAVDTANSPNTIEKAYSLSIVPEGFELCEYDANDIYVYSLYRNRENQRLILQQTVKSQFHPHINTEGYDLQETSVDGCNAVYIEYITDQGVSSMVIWDNEDYIIKLSGDFNKYEMLDLAICNEKQGF